MPRMLTLRKVLICSLVLLLQASQVGSVSAGTGVGTRNEPRAGHIFDAAAPARLTNYYLADRVIHNNDFAKLANWGINTAIVDFDVNGSAAAWRDVFTSAAASNIDVVIWPSDWNNPRPHCGWEAPYPVSTNGNIQKVKPLLDVASQYTNFIGIVNAHESFWTCDMSFDEMAGLKDQLKSYALSKGRQIKVWNYIDNLYSRSMLPDNQIGRIMDVAVTWQHCAGNVEGTCNTSSSTSALNMILNDRKRIADSGAQVELVFLIQTFTTQGYSTRFTLSQLQDYSCQFLNTSALDGFGFYTWHAGWWSDLHNWPDLQPAVKSIYDSCIHNPSSISGNVGVGGVTLSYTDGAPKAATSLGDGSFSLLVSHTWSGTVTPSHACFTFSPNSRSYDNLTTNQSAQDYVATFNPASGCADIAVWVGGIQRGRNGLLPGTSTRASFPNLNHGPVAIMSNNAISLIAAERVIYKVNGLNTSFSEMMALPNSQLDTTYWLPWYNNVDLDTQLRLANTTGSAAIVHVWIGGSERQGSPFVLSAGESTRKSFSGINAGPVKITSDHGVPIVAAERLIYKFNGVAASFSETMALPNSQLDTICWLPWYNNMELDTQLRFSNVTDQPASVQIFIGNTEMEGSPFTLAAGESTRKSFPGVNAGPVKILSDQNIVAAERLIYKVNNINTSFTEMMALPNSQLDTTYWMPWYNNKDLDTQLRFANTTNMTATVHIYIGGAEVPNSPFTLLPGESSRQSFANTNNGPVKIVSDVPLVAAERLIYKVNNVNTSFSEMMALPDTQLDTTYWLPWYNNVDLDTQLRFGVP